MYVCAPFAVASVGTSSVPRTASLGAGAPAGTVIVTTREPIGFQRASASSPPPGASGPGFVVRVYSSSTTEPVSTAGNEITCSRASAYIVASASAGGTMSLISSGDAACATPSAFTVRAVTSSSVWCVESNGMWTSANFSLPRCASRILTIDL